MQDIFKIYIDRLSDGKTEEIKEAVLPAILKMDENELHFEKELFVEGKAYIAHDDLVLHLNIRTACEMPCKVCNQMTRHPICIDNLFIAQPLDEIKGAVFDFTHLIRENVLIDIPQFTECDSGKCPKRNEIQQYLKNTKEKSYFPFQELNVKSGE